MNFSVLVWDKKSGNLGYVLFGSMFSGNYYWRSYYYLDFMKSETMLF